MASKVELAGKVAILSLAMPWPCSSWSSLSGFTVNAVGKGAWDVKKLTVCLVAAVLTFGCCLGARRRREDLGLLYEGLFESFGGQELQEIIPQEAQELLPEDAATSPSGLMEALSLRNIVNVASGGLYQIIRSCLQDFSRLILVVLLVVLAGALSDAFHAEFAAPGHSHLRLQGLPWRPTASSPTA